MVANSVARISPCYRGRNGSLLPIGKKGRFLLMVNVEKRNGNVNQEHKIKQSVNNSKLN